MKKMAWCVIILVVVLAAVAGVGLRRSAGGGPIDLPLSAEAETLADGNAVFAFDLYQELRATEGNLFLSPYSISTALAMTYAGARDQTEAQMAAVLRFPPDRETLHPSFAALQSHLRGIQKKGHVKLSVANSLWPQKKYRFLKDYLSLLKTYYGARITPVDYAGAPDAAARKINGWVEDRTQEKITDIIQPGVLDSLTRLVLVNAIYFKGDWKDPFETADTRDLPFHISADQSVQVRMMDQTHRFRYASLPSFRMLELPYEGEDLSMLILLPYKVDGLEELEGSLSAENLAAWRKELSREKVWVQLPRFKMTSEFQLSETLQIMGMTDAFSEARANFAGMDGNPNWLYISGVIHKAFVDVNEEGTEAAAATAVVVVPAMAAPSPPAMFHADHPFFFLVQENRTGSILFMGRVADPAEADTRGP